MTGVLRSFLKVPRPKRLDVLDQGDDMSGYESSTRPLPSSASSSLCSMGRLKEFLAALDHGCQEMDLLCLGCMAVL